MNVSKVTLRYSYYMRCSPKSVTFNIRSKQTSSMRTMKI